jgi:hypothetical protein
MSTDPEVPWDWLAMYRDNPLFQGSFDQIMTRLALARQAASADADMSSIPPGRQNRQGPPGQIMGEVYWAHLMVGLLELRLCELADERMKQ